MKKILSLVCGFTALLFASCTSDEPVAPGTNTGTGDDENVYATLTLKLPASDRTRTNNGEEFGKDYENNVGKILVVLATKDNTGRYEKVAVAEADAMNSGIVKPEDNHLNQVKYTLNFKASDFYSNPLDEGATLPGEEVYAFVYCNPTTSLLERYQTSKEIYKIDNVTGLLKNGTESEIWRPNQFLMTNCEIAKAVKIPSRTELVTNHNVPEKALDLGTVKVKRVCARFDFATTTVDESLGANKYTVKSLDGTGNIGVIELTDMAMFNVQKEFYYIPRTSLPENGWNWKETALFPTARNYELCGDLEEYVMSVNTDDFKNKLNSATNNKDRTYFFNNLISNDLSESDDISGDNLAWTSLRDWNKKDVDNDEGWTEEGTKGDYRIWRYCTENTIPKLSSTQDGENTASQRQGITTGVVFKAEFTPYDQTVWNGNVIYVHNNIIYGDFAALKKYVTENPDTKVAQEFNSIAALKNGSTTDLKKDLLAGVAAANVGGFKSYAKTAEVKDAAGNVTGYKYVMYYFYFNRHKSNGNNSLMGTNEFGVVRNNVYKLSVTAIRSLGEPAAPTTPNTPDEQEEAYFTVKCLVMPWTVRVNNIEF